MRRNQDWIKELREQLNGLDMSEFADKISFVMERIRKEISSHGMALKESLDNVYHAVEASEAFSELKKIFKTDEWSVFDKTVKENGGYKTLVQFAWNLEERHVEQMTLESVIEWTKENFNPKIHSAGCLYVKRQMLGEIQGHVCFLGKNEEPMLDGNENHLIIYSRKMDMSLNEQLGNKNMLILR